MASDFEKAVEAQRSANRAAASIAKAVEAQAQRDRSALREANTEALRNFVGLMTARSVPMDMIVRKPELIKQGFFKGSRYISKDYHIGWILRITQLTEDAIEGGGSGWSTGYFVTPNLDIRGFRGNNRDCAIEVWRNSPEINKTADQFGTPTDGQYDDPWTMRHEDFESMCVAAAARRLK